MDTRQQVVEILEKHGVKIDFHCKYLGVFDRGLFKVTKHGYDQFSVRMVNHKGFLCCNYSMGFGHRSSMGVVNHPKMEDVLMNLVLDRSFFQDKDLNEWMEDFGYNDSDKKTRGLAKQAYHLSCKRSKELESFLGKDCVEELSSVEW